MVCPSDEANCDFVIRAAEYLDRIPCRNLAALHDPQVRAWSPGTCELQRETWITHPNAEFETWHPRSGYLEHDRPHPPALADRGARDLHRRIKPDFDPLVPEVRDTYLAMKR